MLEKRILSFHTYCKQTDLETYEKMEIYKKKKKRLRSVFEKIQNQVNRKHLSHN